VTQPAPEYLAGRVMQGELLSDAEARTIAELDPHRLTDLLYWASRIRERFFGRRINFCCIAPGRLGGCDQDCAWCGQSGQHVPATRDLRPSDHSRLLEAARAAGRTHASCFCVVTPGRRPTDNDLRTIEALNAALGNEGLPSACASLGELDSATARRLRSAGVVRYNHNLETSRAHFARVVTTHSYDDRLLTLRAARDAGMALCCGGIFGIGETWTDRIELAMTLRNSVKPDVVPLNFLDPRPGTPLADMRPLSPRECLHIIALFRCILPTTNVKIAGGRRLLRDLQSWVFFAGATSLMVGHYLTTTGRSAEIDIQMAADLGLELTRGDEGARC